jgi:hypothetical protein
MDWFSAPALERLERQREAATFNGKCEALWGGLKLMLRKTIDLYMDRYPPVQHDKAMRFDDTNPNTPFVIRVIPAVPPPALPTRAEQEEARVTITFSPPQVTASFSTGRPNESFAMNRDSEGYIVLSYRSKPVPFDRAAEIILKSILFFELP